MAYWLYVADSKASRSTVEMLRERNPLCPCGGLLNRLAERQREAPWHWIPTGWICSSCGAAFIESVG